MVHRFHETPNASTCCRARRRPVGFGRGLVPGRAAAHQHTSCVALLVRRPLSAHGERHGGTQLPPRAGDRGADPDRHSAAGAPVRHLGCARAASRAAPRLGRGARALGGAAQARVRILMARAWPLAALLVAAALSAGCERASASRNGAALVVAKVNGSEISAREAAGALALEKVIDRELLVQRALAAGLERDPQVAQSIDNARRQVLAQAYLEQAAAAVSRVSAEEVRTFYAANPALFAERRIYRV